MKIFNFCFENPSKDPAPPICFCPEGFSGDFCEIGGVDPCDPNPCENGATCTQIGSGEDDFECTCIPGFVGRLCNRGIQILYLS